VPKKIISGIPSVTEILFALGAGGQVIGVTTNCNYPPPAKNKIKVGDFFLNVEKIVALKPDLVVLLEEAQKTDVQRLKSFGLNVFTINPHSLDELAQSYIILGEKVGRRWQGEQLAAQLRRQAGRYKPRAFSLDFVLRRPRLLIVVGYRPLIVVGGGSFIDDIIKAAGAENIAGEARMAYPEYSFEKLLQIDPDFIVLPNNIGVNNDPRWQLLSAVKKNRILMIDPDILSRPGPRVVLAIEKIARFIREN